MIVDGDGDGDVNGLFDPQRPRETVAVAVAVNDQVKVNVYVNVYGRGALRPKHLDVSGRGFFFRDR